MTHAEVARMHRLAEIAMVEIMRDNSSYAKTPVTLAEDAYRIARSMVNRGSEVDARWEELGT